MRFAARRKALSAALSGALLLAFSNLAFAQSAPVYQFDIPAESLSKSLRDFSAASSHEILFSDDVIGDRKAPALHGSYTAEQALAILLSGTELRVETSGSGVLMVRPKKDPAAIEEGARFGQTTETVIVTAEKKAEDIQDVPVPVSVIKGDTL